MTFSIGWVGAGMSQVTAKALPIAKTPTTAAMMTAFLVFMAVYQEDPG